MFTRLRFGLEAVSPRPGQLRLKRRPVGLATPIPSDKATRSAWVPRRGRARATVVSLGPIALVDVVALVGTPGRMPSFQIRCSVLPPRVGVEHQPAPASGARQS